MHGEIEKKLIKELLEQHEPRTFWRNKHAKELILADDRVLLEELHNQTTNLATEVRVLKLLVQCLQEIRPEVIPVFIYRVLELTKMAYYTHEFVDFAIILFELVDYLPSVIREMLLLDMLFYLRSVLSFDPGWWRSLVLRDVIKILLYPHLSDKSYINSEAGRLASKTIDDLPWDIPYIDLEIFQAHFNNKNNKLNEILTDLVSKMDGGEGLIKPIHRLFFRDKEFQRKEDNERKFANDQENFTRAVFCLRLLNFYSLKDDYEYFIIVDKLKEKVFNWLGKDEVNRLKKAWKELSSIQRKDLGDAIEACDPDQAAQVLGWPTTDRTINNINKAGLIRNQALSGLKSEKDKAEKTPNSNIDNRFEQKLIESINSKLFEDDIHNWLQKKTKDLLKADTYRLLQETKKQARSLTTLKRYYTVLLDFYTQNRSESAITILFSMFETTLKIENPVYIHSFVSEFLRQIMHLTPPMRFSALSNLLLHLQNRAENQWWFEIALRDVCKVFICESTPNTGFSNDVKYMLTQQAIESMGWDIPYLDLFIFSIYMNKNVHLLIDAADTIFTTLRIGYYEWRKAKKNLPPWYENSSKEETKPKERKKADHREDFSRAIFSLRFLNQFSTSQESSLVSAAELISDSVFKSLSNLGAAQLASTWQNLSTEKRTEFGKAIESCDSKRLINILEWSEPNELIDKIIQTGINTKIVLNIRF